MLYAHDTKVEFGPAHMKESEWGLQFESFINNQTWLSAFSSSGQPTFEQLSPFSALILNNTYRHRY